MRKMTLLCLVVLAVTIMPAYGQGLYLKLGAGYAMSTGKQEFMANNLVVTSTSIDEFQVRHSYGKGIIPTLGIGYMFHKNIGIELTSNYLIGGTTRAEQSGRLISGISNMTVDIRSKARGFSLQPALRLQTPLNKRMQLYSRTGLVIPLGGKIITDINTLATAGHFGTQVKQTSELWWQATVGFAGALGLNVDLGKHVAIWGEINGQMLQVWAKGAELTAFSINGVDTLAYLNQSDRQTKYVKELHTTSNNMYNPRGITVYLPYEELSKQMTLNNVGMSIGVALRL